MNDDFVRLLAEIHSLGMNEEDKEAICGVMNLTGAELETIFIRATKQWEKIKLNMAKDEPLLDIDYQCPECLHSWKEQWSCYCDSTCPACGTRNIQAL